MSMESKDFDPYAIVLADLKTKREQINQAIQAIESIRAGVGVVQSSNSEVRSESSNVSGEGAFLGLSIPEATKKLLSMRKRAMNNAAVLAELKQGGLVLTANDPINTIGAVLSRRFNDVGDIVRVDRGTWGLKEWYPNRSFAKTVKQNGEGEIKPASNENSPPVMPKNDVPPK